MNLAQFLYRYNLIKKELKLAYKEMNNREKTALLSDMETILNQLINKNEKFINYVGIRKDY